MKILYIEDEVGLAETMIRFFHVKGYKDIVWINQEQVEDFYGEIIRLLNSPDHQFDGVIQDFNLEAGGAVATEVSLRIPKEIVEIKQRHPNFFWIVLSGTDEAREVLDKFGFAQYDYKYVEKGERETNDKLLKLLEQFAPNT